MSRKRYPAAMSDLENIVQVRPGRVAALLPAAFVENASEESALALIGEGLQFAAQSGAQMVQALVHPSDEWGANRLRSCGFAYLTDVLYLVCRQLAVRPSIGGPQLGFVPLDGSAEMQRRLSSIISRTYEASLDCPQLNNLRSIDDVLASYRAVGEYDPSRWWIVEREQSDVGCLLLAAHPQQHELEIVYMGIVPEYRGRRWGIELLRKAKQAATSEGAAQLSLAVDAKNLPALAIYRAEAFEVVIEHRLFLRQI